jgi:hypothetical protein
MTRTTEVQHAEEAEAGQPGSMSETMLVHVRAEKLDAAGEQRIRLTVTQLRQSMGGGILSYDSAVPAGKQERYPGPVDLFNAVIGTEIVVTIGASGSLTAASGIDELFDRLGMASLSFSPRMLSHFRLHFGDYVLRRMIFDASTRYLPRDAKAEGERWTVRNKMSLLAMCEIEMEEACILKEVQHNQAGNLATIEFSGKFSASGPLSMGLMGLELSTVDVRRSGQIRINPETGMPISQSCLQVTSAEATGRGAFRNEMRVEISFRPAKESESEPVRLQAR